MEQSPIARSARDQTRTRSPNKFGARRDAWLVRLANVGPIWIGILVQLRLFRTRQAAERRLRKLEEAGRMRYAGRVSIDGGRKSHVWCNRKFWGRMLRHETDVMRVFFAFWPHAYAVTGGDVDPRWRADMEMTIGPMESGRKFLVEVDEDTEPLGQVRKRLAGYRDSHHTVLFVVPTAARVREVLRLTDNPVVYVSTIDRCLLHPWGSHWVNCLEEAAAIQEPGGVELPGSTVPVDCAQRVGRLPKLHHAEKSLAARSRPNLVPTVNPAPAETRFPPEIVGIHGVRTPGDPHRSGLKHGGIIEILSSG